MVRLTLPPAPPSALTLAIESPPVMLALVTLSWPPTCDEKVASPALPELAVAWSTPEQPLPPMAVPFTWLKDAPELPDEATADELATLLASDCEVPIAMDSTLTQE